MKKFCEICGKSSGMYPLCKDCFKLKDEGKIVKCEDCGSWHYTNKPCKCKKIQFTELPLSGFNECIICGEPTTGYAFCKKCFREHTQEELLDILNNAEIYEKDEDDEADNNEKFEEINTINKYSNKTKCIICGTNTDGNLFCTNCYHKYKNKEILLKITNCVNIELLDEDYEGRYICKDGHIVKSKSERDIDNYLFEHEIPHAYEKEISYGINEKEVLHPDFFLPNYLGKGKHVYIEHWGYNEDNIQYTNTKKFKMPIYEKLGITLICTYEKTDMKKIDSVLDRKLNKNFIKIGEINYEEKTTKNEINFDDNDIIPF